MNLNYINEFVTVIECGTFAKAADVLYTSQPVLSRHIQQLEKSVGCILIIRATPLVLTPAGKYFFDNIKEILISLDSIQKTTNAIANNVSGNIRIGIPQYTRNHFLPMIRKYQRVNPNVNTELHMDSTIGLINDFLDKKLDIITYYNYCGLSDKLINEFPHSRIEKGAIALLVNEQDFAYKKLDSVSIYDLQGKKFSHANDSFHTEQFKHFSDIAKNFGVDVIESDITSNFDRVLMNVTLHDRLTIIPNTDEGLYGKDYRILPIRESEFYFERFLLWSNDNSIPHLDAFIKCLKNIE